MESHDANAMFINGFTARQPIRLRSATFRSGMFADDSPRKSSGNAEDEKNNYGWARTIYLLPAGYISGYGIDGVAVVTLNHGAIECIMPWTEIEYVEVFNRDGWNGEIPECLRKLAEQSEKPSQDQQSTSTVTVKSGYETTAGVSDLMIDIAHEDYWSRATGHGRSDLADELANQ